MDTEKIKTETDYDILFAAVTGSDSNLAVAGRERFKALAKQQGSDGVIAFLRPYLTTSQSFEAYSVIADITGLQFMEAVMKYPARKK